MSHLSQESLRAGADLVSFSGDKLLGGPQAGILAGKPEIVARLRRNPMFRALRLDKLIYQALEGTLRALVMEQWDRVPALRMIRASADEIRERATRLVEAVPGLRASVEAGESVIDFGASILLACSLSDDVIRPGFCRAEGKQARSLTRTPKRSTASFVAGLLNSARRARRMGLVSWLPMLGRIDKPLSTGERLPTSRRRSVWSTRSRGHCGDHRTAFDLSRVWPVCPVT